jgi:multidrug efflux pump subunit AcrA (membrane-fusion protein)
MFAVFARPVRSRDNECMVLSRCLVPLLVSLSLLFCVSCSKQLNAVSPSAPDVPTVAVAKVSPEDLAHNLVLTAEFKPFQEIDVMAKVAGYIKDIKFDVGDHVRQGQLLATL